MSNALFTTATFQNANLALLSNAGPFIKLANKKFKDFQTLIGNLGTTVNIELPVRLTSTDSLVASFQGVTQRYASLTVDKAASTAMEFSNQEVIFNVEDYMERFGRTAVLTVATKIEANMASKVESSTYRFYGDATSNGINSHGALAAAVVALKALGGTEDRINGILPESAVPTIVTSGLSQFAVARNNEEANSWELPSFAGADWYTSRLLTHHTAGAIGNASTTAARTLTVVSTDDATGANITQITCTDSTGTLTDANAIKAHDLGEFVDGVSGQTNVRFTMANAQDVSADAKCQIRITANAGATSGTIVLNIAPGLCVTSGSAKRNINTNIVAGMEILIMPSHRCGLLYFAPAMFLAMPRLPEERPFDTKNENDPETGVAIRMYQGSDFGKNLRGTIYDAAWGGLIVPEYAVRLLFPA